MLINDINNHFFNKFKFQIEKSVLKQYDAKSWQKFCRQLELNDAEGAYLLCDYSAHLLAETKYFHQNLYHEYFGHGLFVEHSLIGKKLKNLETRAIIETESFDSDKDYACQELSGYFNNYQEFFEGFALWIEYYLSRFNHELETFNDKFSRLNRKKQLLLEKFRLYEEKYNDYSLVYSCALPKHYNPEILETILHNIFEKNSIKFALVYGSRKPYSDIDIFMVSNNKPLFLGWLDVYSVDNEHFTYLTNMLDIYVTEALFTGTFITGDRNYYNKVKAKILDLNITTEQINFNLKQSKLAGISASKHLYGSKLYNQYLSYKISYLVNAKLLSQNRKALTLKNLFTC